jgi:hypothetical protein
MEDQNHSNEPYEDNQIPNTENQIPKRNISKEKQKEYNTTFYAENKNKKYHCEICRKEVNYFNKSRHIKTSVHQRLSK